MAPWVRPPPGPPCRWQRPENVPFVGAFTGAQLLRGPELTSVLNVRASYHDETEEMVRYLQSMGKTKVAVLYQNDSYGQDGLAGVKQALAKRDMEPVESWYYPRNTTAVKAAAFRIAKAEPDAVIIIGGYASHGQIHRAVAHPTYGMIPSSWPCPSWAATRSVMSLCVSKSPRPTCT